MSHMMKASALKNSGRTNRHESYPTPISLVRLMVKQALATRVMAALQTRPVIRVLDLCAGNAAWGIVAKEELKALGFKVHLTAIEIDPTILPAPEVDEWIEADFRVVDDLDPFDFIFSNPPFSLVYEITAWAQQHLLPWGVFTLLIGSNFMFAETLLKKWLPTTRPILELKLTRRPSFIQLFASKRNDVKKRNKKGTNAKDYTGYYFAGDALCKWLTKRMDFLAYLNIQSDRQPWVTVDQYWDYTDDPLEAILLERPVTVQQMLIREAAESDNDLKFDYYWALMAANEYGWALYEADRGTRHTMIVDYIERHIEGFAAERAAAKEYELALMDVMLREGDEVDETL